MWAVEAAVGLVELSVVQAWVVAAGQEVSAISVLAETQVLAELELLELQQEARLRRMRGRGRLVLRLALPGSRQMFGGRSEKVFRRRGPNVAGRRGRGRRSRVVQVKRLRWLRRGRIAK